MILVCMDRKYPYKYYGSKQHHFVYLVITRDDNYPLPLPQQWRQTRVNQTQHTLIVKKADLRGGKTIADVY